MEHFLAGMGFIFILVLAMLSIYGTITFIVFLQELKTKVKYLDDRVDWTRKDVDRCERRSREYTDMKITALTKKLEKDQPTGTGGVEGTGTAG